MSDSVNPNIKKVGEIFAQYRHRKGWNRQRLAKKVSDEITVSTIALLEQGKRLPSGNLLSEIADCLEIPESTSSVFSHSGYLEAMEFQVQLGEFLGKSVHLDDLDEVSQKMAIEAISLLLCRGMSLEQAYSHFNSILTFYGEKSVSRDFFRHFLGEGNFSSVEDFKRKVKEFQEIAIRIYGSFRQAFKVLRSAPDIRVELAPLKAVDEILFTKRRPFFSVENIPADRLDDLGYISAERIRLDHRERQGLSTKLHQFAQWLKEHPEESAHGYAQVSLKNFRRIQTLLRHFDSPLEIEDTLFSSIDAEAVEKEAIHIAPKDSDLARIQETQEMGLRNLAAYLTEPHMDIYIATSMRERADFISVNAFVTDLFQDSAISHLNLRYFNPTQSWVADRVAKGLVEALILKRSKISIYMAQKTDTFGKDSEASVSLGQGKPVIVYVPKLLDLENKIDSEELMKMADHQLQDLGVALGIDLEEGGEGASLATQILTHQLQGLPQESLIKIIDKHWADFDLYGELKDLELSQRENVESYLNLLTLEEKKESSFLDSLVAKILIEKLVQVALFFEKRAKTFKEIHPLALQVILSSGVLNGILVVRSAGACARVVYELLTNTIKTTLIVDEHNYKLIEENTGSTLRVISKHKLLTNAFWTQYFAD